MPPKCSWCGKREDDLIHEELTFRGEAEKAYFCSQNHLEETRKFLKYAETHVWHFILGLILLPVVGMLITFMILENAGLFVIFAGFGLVIIIFPFATPQTNSLLGIKNSIMLVRAIGAVLVVSGIFLLFI